MSLITQQLCDHGCFVRTAAADAKSPCLWVTGNVDFLTRTGVPVASASSDRNRLAIEIQNIPDEVRGST